MDYKNLSRVTDSVINSVDSRVADSNLTDEQALEIVKEVAEKEGIPHSIAEDGYIQVWFDINEADEEALKKLQNVLPVLQKHFPDAKIKESDTALFISGHYGKSIGDSVNRTTLVEEVLDADFQVIKREIDEKGSCFKTAEKIASLIGSTKGGVKKFEEELKDSDIKGISYKKGEKDDYMGIRGTVVYGTEDSFVETRKEFEEKLPARIESIKKKISKGDVIDYRANMAKVIKVEEDGVTIKGPYTSQKIDWEDVVEYNRDLADQIEDSKITDSLPEEVKSDIEEYKEHKGIWLAEQVKNGAYEVSAKDIAKELGDIYDDDEVEEEVMNNFAHAGVKKVKFFQNNDSVDWECVA